MTDSYDRDPKLSMNERFFGAFDSVDYYNCHQSTLEIFAPSVSEFMIAAGLASKDDVIPIEFEAFQQQDGLVNSLINSLRAEELAGMGMHLFGVSEDGIEQFDPREYTGKRPRTLLILIADNEKFKAMISELNIFSHSDKYGRKVLGAVNSLLLDSILLITSVYKAIGGSIEDPTQYFKDLEIDPFETFREVSTALADRGFGVIPAYTTLAEYTSHSEAGTLGAYLGIETLGLLKDKLPEKLAQNFDPVELEAQWQQAFDCLRELQDSSSPSFPELFDKVRTMFDRIAAEIDDETRKQLMGNLTIAWEEQFPEANAFYLIFKADESQK